MRYLCKRRDRILILLPEVSGDASDDILRLANTSQPCPNTPRTLAHAGGLLGCKDQSTLANTPPSPYSRSCVRSQFGQQRGLHTATTITAHALVTNQSTDQASLIRRKCEIPVLWLLRPDIVVSCRRSSLLFHAERSTLVVDDVAVFVSAPFPRRRWRVLTIYHSPHRTSDSSDGGSRCQRRSGGRP